MDDSGLPFVPRTSRPGHWNLTVHGDFASAFLTALMFAIENSTMITAYGAYARITSARESGTGPDPDPAPEPGGVSEPPPPAEPVAVGRPVETAAAAVSGTGRRGAGTPPVSVPTTVASAASSTISGASAGRQTRSRPTTAAAETSEATMSVSGTEM